MRGYSSSRSQRLCERLFVQKVPGGMRPLQWVLFSGGKYLGIWRLSLLRLERILKFIAHHINLSRQSHKNISVKRLTYSCYLFFRWFYFGWKRFRKSLYSTFNLSLWLIALFDWIMTGLFGMTETCYSCDFVHDQRMCNTTTVCGQGEVSFSLITLTLYYDLANYLT